MVAPRHASVSHWLGPGLAFALVVLLLTVSLTATAQQDEYPAGELLNQESPDALLPLASLSETALCFIDETDTGGYTTEEPVILTTSGTCSGNATRDDVRLSGQGVAGERIGTDYLAGQALSAPESAASFSYHDTDASGALSPADTVYVKMRQVDEATVSSTDVRITSYAEQPAGSTVHHGDPDEGLTLKSLGTPKAQVRYVDLEGDGNFTRDDLLYLPLDPKKETLSAGDVRLLSAGPQKPYGSTLEHGLQEAVATITKIERPLCYVDRDASGGRAPAEPLYLSRGTQCSGPAQVHDVLLSRSADAEAGHRVQESDGDHEAELSGLPEARLVYVDLDNSSTRTQGDLFLVQIDDPETEAVQAYDLLLTPTRRGAGAVLAPDDELVGQPVVDLGLFKDAVAYTKNGAGSEPGPSDPFYLSPDGKAGDSLSPADLRLTPLGEHPSGGPVGLETGEIVPTITRKSAGVCSPSTIPEDYSRGDAVYLRADGTCPSTVQPGLLRLVAVGDHDALTRVEAGDGDINESLVAAPSTLNWKYHDADDNDVINAGDTLYLDLVDPDDDEVKTGDLRVTRLGSLAAGEAVYAGDNDFGNPLTLLGPVNKHTVYIQAEGEKFAYITQDATATEILISDVRLTALPAVFTAPAADVYVEPPAKEQEAQADPDDSPQAGHDDPDNEPEGDDQEEDVPAPMLAGVLAILGVLAVIVRSSRRP